MLNADVPVPNVLANQTPTYGRIFHSLLSRASPNTKITSEDFDVTKCIYPPSLDDFDAIIISGSACSAYEDLPWIHRLDEYITDVYAHHPRIKIFGSCFGHQIICQSLLRRWGVKVERDAKGWEIGVKEVKLDKQFREDFSEGEQGWKLQFVHHDHVVIPAHGLPDEWVVVGRTEHCAVQGVYQLGRIFTLQGHFEFDRVVNSEVIRFFFENEWDEKRLGDALEAIDVDDDSALVARWIARFLNGKVDGEGWRSIGGLLTPPKED